MRNREGGWDGLRIGRRARDCRRGRPNSRDYDFVLMPSVDGKVDLLAGFGTDAALSPGRIRGTLRDHPWRREARPVRSTGYPGCAIAPTRVSVAPFPAG